jgi:hypothetical protein
VGCLFKKFSETHFRSAFQDVQLAPYVLYALDDVLMHLNEPLLEAYIVSPAYSLKLFVQHQ